MSCYKNKLQTYLIKYFGIHFWECVQKYEFSNLEMHWINFKCSSYTALYVWCALVHHACFLLNTSAFKHNSVSYTITLLCVHSLFYRWVLDCSITLREVIYCSSCFLRTFSPAAGKRANGSLRWWRIIHVCPAGRLHSSLLSAWFW